MLTMKELIDAIQANWQGYEELRALILKKGDFFRIVTKNGKVGKATYTKGEFDRSSKAYSCIDYEDISHEKFLKPTQQITTEFIY